MKVLLVSPNRSRLTVVPCPIGLASVAGSIDPRRHPFTVWDAMFRNDWRESLKNIIHKARPDLIGVSVRNADDQEMTGPTLFLEEVREMVQVCRMHSDAPIVVGGGGFAIFEAEALTFLDADFGIRGDGEAPFNALMDRLESGRDPSDIPGLVYRDTAQDPPVVRANPPDWPSDLSALPGPAYDLLTPAQYHEARGTANIPNRVAVQAKRGCNQRCIYCSTRHIEGPTLRLRSPEFVVEQIRALQAASVRRIQFADSLFTNPRHHGEAICEALIKSGLDADFSCTVKPGFVDRELLRLMKRAGLKLLVVGNESVDDRVLENLRKGFTRADVEKCFSLCEAEEIPFNAFLLVGGPGEDRESTRQSVETLERFHPMGVTVTVGIRIYPDCELARIARSEGKITSDDGLLRPRFYLSDHVRDWIRDYMDRVVERNPRWHY